jgi:hypothetical protein
VVAPGRRPEKAQVPAPTAEPPAYRTRGPEGWIEPPANDDVDLETLYEDQWQAEAESDSHGPSQTAVDEEIGRAFVKPRMTSLLPETAQALKKKWKAEAASPVVPVQRMDIMRKFHKPPEPPARSWRERFGE